MSSVKNCVFWRITKKHPNGMLFLCKVSANISKCITTPSSRVSPHLLSQRGNSTRLTESRSNTLFRHFVPYGARTLRIVLSLCHLSLGGFLSGSPATGVLLSGAWHSLPRSERRRDIKSLFRRALLARKELRNSQLLVQSAFLVLHQNIAVFIHNLP